MKQAINQEKINRMEIKDYISMRKKKQASNVAWRNVRSLHVSNGNTFWQILGLINEDYDSQYEPSMVQLKKAEDFLSL